MIDWVRRISSQWSPWAHRAHSAHTGKVDFSRDPAGGFQKDFFLLNLHHLEMQKVSTEVGDKKLFFSMSKLPPARCDALKPVKSGEGVL